jgi:hypothetical protein
MACMLAEPPLRSSRPFGDGDALRLGFGRPAVAGAHRFAVRQAALTTRTPPRPYTRLRRARQTGLGGGENRWRWGRAGGGRGICGCFARAALEDGAARDVLRFNGWDADAPLRFDGPRDLIARSAARHFGSCQTLAQRAVALQLIAAILELPDGAGVR